MSDGQRPAEPSAKSARITKATFKTRLLQDTTLNPAYSCLFHSQSGCIFLSFQYATPGVLNEPVKSCLYDISQNYSKRIAIVTVKASDYCMADSESSLFTVECICYLSWLDSARCRIRWSSCILTPKGD